MTAPPRPTTTNVPALPPGWHAARYAVLNDGRLAVTGADNDIFALLVRDIQGRSHGEVAKLVENGTTKVWGYDDGRLHERLALPALSPFATIDRFSDGRWLVDGDPQGDALILDAHGVELRRIRLGYGISHVQLDGKDRIWVGWFDEGVFGNDKWLLAGREWPVSAHGIAAFDEHGALLHHATLESVADCYALNVFNNESWSRTYTDFPIWRMVDGVEQTWSTDLNGVAAIAVQFPYVLAASGYEPDENLVTLLKLHERAAETLGEWRILVPRRGELGLVAARGDELHVVADGQWMRWRVADFVKLSD